MGIKVLLVDDEAEFVETLRERLDTRGFETQTALGGNSALGAVQEREFDVIILDVVMPDVGGIDVLREMKRLCPLTEVIMLTGYATVETAIAGMKLGAYDYLMKPTDMEYLVEKIGNAYQRKAEQEERIRKAEIDKIVKRRGW